ncbi:ABC transporter permease [Alkalihalobacillus pseudalcaliphilus]|uniref:ABC transporter permease n=1 Tax=Alkalihalobacillus pseudalcaliphilus TaxID=79884 RepID=UPI00064DBDF3|nr:ABC transporter permease [Alkalihalobacillus pseudalcaliphilus]KMK76110.1 hypothetical protein AB990_12855 [Alkalihalobacillus pseudalcaliphilus]
MKNSMKVAKWEIKRNLRNKSFIISILSTPLLFILFFSIPMLFNSGGETDQNSLTLYVEDPLEVWSTIDSTGLADSLDWDVELTTETPSAAFLDDKENSVMVSFQEEHIRSGQIPTYLSEDLSETDLHQLQAIQPFVKQAQLELFGFENDEIEIASMPVSFIAQAESETDQAEEAGGAFSFLERLVPGIFAGVILFSVVITGMMIFTSASQEKKEKVSEMILSSITPHELMQGKIIGYFVLGVIQVASWIAIILPFLTWYVDFPLLSYLFVPELLVLVLIAVAGYLLFAAIFVGIGATVDEVSSTSNFQGIIFMIPWLPFILLGPILSDPEGLIAQIGSYFPLTAPGVLIIRLSMLEEWPWIEVIISMLILFVTIWLFIKLAGKVFKTGILMYGKNATPKEILKWMRES